MEVILPDAGPAAGAVDTDADGLCDITEAGLGTDPKRADTDGDRLPDLIELASGFDATDPGSPAADQTATLQARTGAKLEFPLRVTVDGEGEAVTGSFQALASIYGDGPTAATFLKGAAAVTAEPADGVRGINSEAGRFEAVLGKVRLEFRLQFAYPVELAEQDALGCTLTYRFRYELKADDGNSVAERLYLLLVGATDSAQPAAHCLPGACQ